MGQPCTGVKNIASIISKNHWPKKKAFDIHNRPMNKTKDICRLKQIEIQKRDLWKTLVIIICV